MTPILMFHNYLMVIAKLVKINMSSAECMTSIKRRIKAVSKDSIRRIRERHTILTFFFSIVFV